MSEYPKALYKGGCADSCLNDTVTVNDADQEDAARADGYEMYAEIHARGDEPAQAAAEQEAATATAPVAVAKPGRKPKAK